MSEGTATPRRRFGTVLSANSPPRNEKEPKVAWSASKDHHHHNVNNHKYTYSVTFDAGVQPLGVQCEPYNLIRDGVSTTGCRIQQFIDGGPSEPGPARQTGRITPGDVIVQVNGQVIENYDQAIDLLKDSTRERVVVLQSPFVGRNGGRASSTARTPKRKTVSLTPSRQNLDSASGRPSTAEQSSNSRKYPGRLQKAWLPRPPHQTPKKTSDKQSAHVTDSTNKPSSADRQEHKQHENDTLVTPKLHERSLSSSSSPLSFSSPFTPSQMDVSLIQSADDLILLTNTARIILGRTTTNGRSELSTNKSLTPCMNVSQSEGSNAMVSADSPAILPVEDMLQHDFAAHYRKDRSSIPGSPSTKDEVSPKTRWISDRSFSPDDNSRQEKLIVADLIHRNNQSTPNNTAENIQSTEVQGEALRRLKEQVAAEQQEAVRKIEAQAARNQAEAVRRTQEKAAEEIDDFRQQLVQQQQVVDQARLERDSAKRTIDQKVQLVEEERCQWQNERQELLEKQRYLQDQLERAQSQLSSKQQENNESSVAIQRLEKQLKDAVCQRGEEEKAKNNYQRELQQIRESLHKDSQRSHEQLQKLRAELQQAKTECNKLHSSLDQEMAERSIVEDKLCQVNNLLLERQSEMDKLREQLQRAKQDSDRLQNNHEADVSIWKQKLEKLQQETSEERGALEARHTDDVLSYQSEIKRLREQLKIMEDKSSRATSKEAQLTASIDVTGKRLEELELELRRRTEDLEEATNVIELLETQLESCDVDPSSRKHLDESRESAALVAARMEISELTQSLTEYRARHERISRDKEDLAGMYRSTVDRLKEQQEKNEEIRSALSTKESEIMRLQTVLDQRTADLDQRTRDLEKCQQAISNTQAEMKTPVQPSEGYSADESFDFDSLARELIAAQDELSEMKARNNDLDRLLRSMRRNLLESERRASFSREQLETEQKNCKRLKSQIAALEEESSHKANQLSNEIRKLQENNLQIEEERSRLERMVRRLESESSDVKDGHIAVAESYESHLKQLKAERASAFDQATKYKIEMADLTERLRHAKGETELAHREISSLRRQHNDEIQSLKTEYQDKFEKYDAIVKEKDKELRALSKAREEIRIIRSELERTERSLQRSREECDLLTALLDEVREDCACKIDDLKGSQKLEVERMTKLKADLENDLLKLKSKLKDYEKQLIESEQASQGLKADRDKLLSEKYNLNDEIQKLKDDVSFMNSEVERLKAAEDAESDMEDDPLTGLSRQELRKSWIQLRNDLDAARRLRSQIENSLIEQQQSYQQLEEQWKELSDETSRLVTSNEQYKERLEAAKSSRAECATALSEEQNKVKALEHNLSSTREQLALVQSECTKISSHASSLQSKLDELSRARDNAENDYKSALVDLRNELHENEKLIKSITDENNCLKQDVANLGKHNNELQQSLSNIQLERECLKARFDEISQYSQSSLQNITSQRDQLQKQLQSSESDCEAIKKKLSEMEDCLEAAKSDAHDKSERIASLSFELDEATTKLNEVILERDEAKSTLAQSMQQAKSYKDSIRQLEGQLEESGRLAESQTAQIESFRETISQLENTSSESLSMRSKQLQETEEKCSSLESERDQLYENIASLREELRESRRHAKWHEDLVKSLKNRIDHLSESLDDTKSDLVKATQDKESTSMSLNKALQDFQNKSREVDHLQARIQVLNATITRMRSDYALLEDNVSRAESQITASQDSRDDEISKLQSKLQSQEAKLASLSEVYKSQQQVLSLSQSLEGQLVNFVESVLHSASDSIFDLASTVTKIEDICSTFFADKNQLVSLGFSKHDASELESTLEELSSIIPRAKSRIEEKHEQLDAWKQRRSLRMAPVPSSFETPTSKAKSKADSPSVLQALEKMKQVLNDEILTPNKGKSPTIQFMDTEYLQKVIFALETQIDALLSDLQSANEALKAKDQLFADMEQMVAHHEAERDNLERKLKQASISLREAEMKLKELKSSSSIVTGDKEQAIACDQSVQGAQMLAAFFENRELRIKASVLRKWTASALCSHMKAQQGQTAEALAMELSTTREKLSILKRHLKKSRRAKGKMQPGLDRIIEDNNGEQGYDTS